MIPFDFRLESPPLGTRSSVIQEEMWTILILGRLPFSGPLVVWHHAGHRQIVTIHEPRSQLGSPIKRLRSVVPEILAHLNSDAVAVPRAIVVRMIPLLISREMLHGPILIRGVVPREMSESTTFQRQRMTIGICSTAPILSAVNRNVFWIHCLARPTTCSVGKVILFDSHLTVKRGRTLARVCERRRS